MHAPEQKRRLVAVGLPIQVGNQEIAALPHLPGDRQIARFVHGQEWAHRNRNRNHHRPQNGQDQDKGEPTYRHGPLLTDQPKQTNGKICGNERPHPGPRLS